MATMTSSSSSSSSCPLSFLSSELEPLSVGLDLLLDDLMDFADDFAPANDFAFTLLHDNQTPPPSPSSPVLDKSTEEEQKPSIADASLTAVTTGANTNTNVNANNAELSFVEKTYNMINSCAAHVACWNASGNGFIVMDTTKFAREVLSEHLKHRNFNSFVCELTLHGFRKTALTKKKAAIECFEFRHPHFLRGQRALLRKVERRQCSSPTRKRTQTQPSQAMASPTSVQELLEELDEEILAEGIAAGDDGVGDLKFQISELQGEVQQTQHLFDKLVSSIMQSSTAATATSSPSMGTMGQQQALGYMTPMNAHYSVYGGVPPQVAGMMYSGYFNPSAMPRTNMVPMNLNPMPMTNSSYANDSLMRFYAEP